MTVYPLLEVTLPQDSVLPEPSQKCERLTDPNALPRPTLAPKNAEEERALSVWLTAHQAFFLSLNLGTFVAHLVKHRAQVGDLEGAAQELDRLAVLRRVHTALTCAAGNISREVYESYIRTLMQARRPDFSGVSSQDNWIYDEAVTAADNEINLLLASVPTGQQSALLRGKRAYEEATRFWWSHHARIMLKLIKEPYSLARLEYERRQREGGRYLSFAEFKQTLRTPTALAENDDFFGVKRGEISLQQFQRTFRYLLRAVQPYQDQTGELPEILAQGSEVMERLLDETLANEAGNLPSAVALRLVMRKRAA